MRLLFKTIITYIYKKLPTGIRLTVAKLYVKYKVAHLRSLITPTALVYFITSRCNARCSHCFYWQDLNSNSANELSLQQIKIVAESLKHPIYLSLTGGEPFLRNDINEICAIFCECNDCRNIGIATNGFLTSIIIQKCREILCITELDSLSIQVSLDGPSAIHNKIRRVQNGFEKSIETIRQLVALSRENIKLNVFVSITIQNSNIDYIEELIEYLIPFGIQVRFALVRGQHFGTYLLPDDVANKIDPLEDESPVRDLTRLDQLFSNISRLNNQSSYKFWSRDQQDKIRISLDIMRLKKKRFGCYAGIIDSVLYANGDVALCELTKPIGNLHDYEFDFSKVWNSSAANTVRSKIDKCFCIHGCNLSTSMRFDPIIVDSIISSQ